MTTTSEMRAPGSAARRDKPTTARTLPTASTVVVADSRALSFSRSTLAARYYSWVCTGSLGVSLSPKLLVNLSGA